VWLFCDLGAIYKCLDLNLLTYLLTNSEIIAVGFDLIQTTDRFSWECKIIFTEVLYILVLRLQRPGPADSWTPRCLNVPLRRRRDCCLVSLVRSCLAPVITWLTMLTCSATGSSYGDWRELSYVCCRLWSWIWPNVSAIRAVILVERPATRTVAGVHYSAGQTSHTPSHPRCTHSDCSTILTVSAVACYI